MGSLTRRTFLTQAGALSALPVLGRAEPGETSQVLRWPGGEVGNAAFRLKLSPRDALRRTRVVHSPSGLVLADSDYSYSFGHPEIQESTLTESPDASLVSARGAALAGQLETLHEFRVPRAHPWVEEQITFTNRGAAPLDLEYARCGFVLPVALSQEDVVGQWGGFKFTAIPYRREPNGNRAQYADFTLAQVLTTLCPSELWTYATVETPAYASEGWAWSDGQRGFLLTKYSQRGMEWSLLDRVPLEGNQVGLRWGGCGIFHGDPEHGAWLLPGESHRFGLTRLTAYSGGMLEGFYAFRAEMNERGHGCPKGFDPPVHWNELYDNKLWWLPGEGQDNPENRKKYYTLADMKEEAAKARAIGAQALYMDPGWDTNFASKIWDEPRLGPYRAFTEILRHDYGLKSSLHTPLSGWCNPTSYPPEMYRLDRFGQRLTWEKARGHGASPLCGASRQYLEETARRLMALARDGAAYFMFDGTSYHGECWDSGHGHPVPARREEHVQALCRLARMIHAEYPQVLIEMHDPVVGGTTIRYTPTYYGHGPAPAEPPLNPLPSPATAGSGQALGEEGTEGWSHAAGFDSVWAFELMWSPMENLLSGSSVTLYYYNLAYGLPLYIHIDLRTDNSQALVFWWNASTCRHLGIGGTHKDPEVRKAHREAMAVYRRLAPFFKAGTFYGVEETIHVHVHPTEPAAVVNCFNLDERPLRKEVEFQPGKFGLDPQRIYNITGVSSQRTRAGYSLRFDLPALGHRLAEISAG